ncbi:hypothetical protein AQUCO_00900634v1 [Aquilegia coerulea]|uniref:Uncharacterized protein n=1 Tax=Aquilegia coerulea TaxID=218851 RepID=A0A2G5EER5_AQUCA|nr:hypothetical protein AQUCO_00900634v1 [Aquilegia coerulea]
MGKILIPVLTISAVFYSKSLQSPKYTLLHSDKFKIRVCINNYTSIYSKSQWKSFSNLFYFKFRFQPPMLLPKEISCYWSEWKYVCPQHPIPGKWKRDRHT